MVAISEDLHPKIIEIITEVLEENMGKEDLRKIAELQIELTEKYSDRLETMEQDIHKKVEDYVELYNKAIQRLMEEEQQAESKETEEWTKNNWAFYFLIKLKYNLLKPTITLPNNGNIAIFS